jgi:RNA polymerase sigma factor (TIGR02999 family)
MSPSDDPPEGRPPAPPAPGEWTVLLRRWSDGDANALDALLPLVYGELRRQAAGLLRGERAAATFEPTALVHDAFLRLAGSDPIAWESRRHFLAVAARAMRRVLVDHARRRDSEKRGGDRARVGLTLADRVADGLGGRAETRYLDILAVDRALERLERISARRARVVEMRFFAGLEDREIAQVLGVSLSTVEREWRTARAFLAKALAAADAAPAAP